MHCARGCRSRVLLDTKQVRLTTQPDTFGCRGEQFSRADAAELQERASWRSRPIAANSAIPQPIRNRVPRPVGNRCRIRARGGGGVRLQQTRSGTACAGHGGWFENLWDGNDPAHSDRTEASKFLTRTKWHIRRRACRRAVRHRCGEGSRAVDRVRGGRRVHQPRRRMSGPFMPM